MFLLRTNKHVKRYSWKWRWSWSWQCCCNSISNDSSCSDTDSDGVTSNFVDNNTRSICGPLNLKSKKDCKDIQFESFRSKPFISTQVNNKITIATPQHEYPVKIDYFRTLNTDGFAYYKNLEAKDPKGRVLLPGGETITITLQTNEEISGDYYGYRTQVILFNDKVSDCQALFKPVEQKDKMGLKIVV